MNNDILGIVIQNLKMNEIVKIKHRLRCISLLETILKVKLQVDFISYGNTQDIRI
jgi:hypothetical protein